MEKLRFLDKTRNFQERKNFSNWWKEQIKIYGQEISYFSNLARLEDMNPLYGEDIESGFSSGKRLIVQLNLNNDAYLLSKFGVLADSDMSGVIHPELFTEQFGLSAEPKMGDLIELTEFGSDRINFPKRGATVYELTEVIDEFQINAIGGHYVWFFKGKRYDFSYENNSPGAGVGNRPINDNDIIEEVSKQNFNYNEGDNLCSDPSVYGDY
jgi:hypothetical protein